MHIHWEAPTFFGGLGAAAQLDTPLRTGVVEKGRGGGQECAIIG